MSKTRTNLLVLATAFIVAGCLGTRPADDRQDADADNGMVWTPYDFPAFTVPKPDFDFSTVVVPDHEAHSVPELHTAGHGFKLTGFASINDLLPTGMRGSITQIDVLNGYALVPGMEGGPAFVIVDIHDPAHPKPVSYMPTVADGWTARFSKVDGDYVFYGCQIVSSSTNTDSRTKGTCRDPAAGPQVGTDSTPQSAINVYDVRDKAHPKFVDSLQSNGSHNLQTAKINGEDYIFTATTEIMKFNRDSERLELVTFAPGTHDSTVGRHPITGDYLLVSGRGGSFGIYNVNDPANPEVILEPGTFPADGWHEQVLFPQLVDGRALLAVAGESGVSAGAANQLAGQLQGGRSLTFLDITDPSKPVELSKWTPPFNPMVPYAEYAFSIHEAAATPQGQIAVSFYHGGTWVLDVSTQERQAHPVVVGVYQPHEQISVLPSTFAQTPIPFVPFVWSAAWDQRGYLVLPDMHTGVYVLEPEWGLVPMLDGGA